MNNELKDQEGGESMKKIREMREQQKKHTWSSELADDSSNESKSYSTGDDLNMALGKIPTTTNKELGVVFDPKTQFREFLNDNQFSELSETLEEGDVFVDNSEDERKLTYKTLKSLANPPLMTDHFIKLAEMKERGEEIPIEDALLEPEDDKITKMFKEYLEKNKLPDRILGSGLLREDVDELIMNSK
jgi:hypothetical protein